MLRNNYAISCVFGADRTGMYRKNPLDKNNYYHEGIDYVGNKLSPIYAELGGVVTHLANHELYGNMVIVKTNLSNILEDLKNSRPFYIEAMYCHLHKINVKFFQEVKEGDLIGLMGNTGNCWTLENGKYRPLTESEKLREDFQGGTHLHLSYRTYDASIINYLKDKNLKIEPFYIFQWGKYYINPLVIECLITNNTQTQNA